VAALNPSITELAGELADGVIFYVMTPDAVNEVLPHLKAGAEKAGRNPAEVDVTCLILASPDDGEDGMFTLKLQLAGFSGSPPYKRRLSESGFAKEMEGASKALADGDQKAAANAISDRMAESIALVGDPSKWDGLLKKYHDAGVDEPIIFPTGAAQGSMDLMRKAVNANIR
jgi:alkanesulfonate monooxygenase SsuD/methylene tetrahydromethanopterin reductase-like flavin-dependent oxidoreductase (luciferase family)